MVSSLNYLWSVYDDKNARSDLRKISADLWSISNYVMRGMIDGQCSIRLLIYDRTDECTYLYKTSSGF